MSRIALMLILPLALVGCGGQPSLPQVPATDNRPSEVKEADDGMMKRAQEINAGKK